SRNRIVQRDDGGAMGNTPVELPVLTLAPLEVVVLFWKRFADQNRVGGPIGDRSGEEHDRAEAVEQAADVLVAPGVSVIGTGGVAPALAVSIAIRLIGVESARTGG